MGGLCPLFFDGAVCDFKELPKPENTTEMTKIYEYLKNLRESTAKTFLKYSKPFKYKRFNLFNKLFYKLFNYKQHDSITNREECSRKLQS